ncbi:hypothetical protein [Parabacteroides sp. 52]|uniref:hypothetical protein n=1 Tax=Parabacteroides sp. 52 TaxID=2302940 RepID=UPI001944DBEE|nr:hypothetical protein [Parabacteroides sp. 52]
MKQKRAVWFGRWSNKPWAVFRSLHTVVHILRIKADMTKLALLKAGSTDNLISPVSLAGLLLLPGGDDPEEECLASLSDFLIEQVSEPCIITNDFNFPLESGTGYSMPVSELYVSGTGFFLKHFL